MTRDTGLFAGHPSQLTGQQVAGYRIEREIGRGGMAVVYRARDLRLDRTVALKLLAPELARNDAFRRRFTHESRTAAAIDHPHIVPVFEAGEADGGILYIAMRYVEGSDLPTSSTVRDPCRPAPRCASPCRWPRHSTPPTSTAWSTGTSSCGTRRRRWRNGRRKLQPMKRAPVRVTDSGMTVRPPSAPARPLASPDRSTDPADGRDDGRGEHPGERTVREVLHQAPDHAQSERGHEAHADQPAQHRDEGLRPAVAGDRQVGEGA
ncbi:Serine/threonine-protein kinase PknD [Streptomyces hirsutus]